MGSKRIYNNGLGPIQLPPPKGLPPHVRAGMRGRLWIEVGGYLDLDEELLARLVTHKTVTPYFLDGRLSTVRRTVERRKPATKLSPEQIDEVLRRGGSPLDLYVGLVPDDELRRLVDGKGSPRVPVTAGAGDLARSNAELQRANEEGSRELAAARAELEKLRAVAKTSGEPKTDDDGKAQSSKPETPKGDEGKGGGKRR